MKTFLALVIISLAWTLKPSESYAQYLKCSKNPVHIHYLNGMFNSRQDVIASKDEIRKLFSTSESWKRITWINEPTFNFSHNRSHLIEAGGDPNNITEELAHYRLLDYLEVAQQKLQNYHEANGISGINAWEEIIKNYYSSDFNPLSPSGSYTKEAIAKLLKESIVLKEEDAQEMVTKLAPFKNNKDKVIIVSHSQGNLHANETFIRLFSDYQIHYPFDRPLDISNDQLTGNLWGNFQIASPNAIVSNPRHKTMRFVQDIVFNKLGPTGQRPTHILLDLPSGIPRPGEFTIEPDNDTNFHTFLLYTSPNYSSGLSCGEACFSDPKTNREHFIDRMQEIAEMLPSNCGEIEPIVKATIINTSTSNYIVKNHTRLEVDLSGSSYGKNIQGLDDNDRKLLISKLHLAGQVFSECKNIDSNPYFCDEDIDRSPASVPFISSSDHHGVAVTNTFGETKHISNLELNAVFHDGTPFDPTTLTVYRGDEDQFDPVVSYTGPLTFEAGVDTRITYEVKDHEFKDFVPSVYVYPYSHGPDIVNFAQIPNSLPLKQKLYIRATGKFGAIRLFEQEVTVSYCQGDDCCEDGKVYKEGAIPYCVLKSPTPRDFLKDKFQCTTSRYYDLDGSEVQRCIAKYPDISTLEDYAFMQEPGRVSAYSATGAIDIKVGDPVGTTPMKGYYTYYDYEDGTVRSYFSYCDCPW